MVEALNLVALSMSVALGEGKIYPQTKHMIMMPHGGALEAIPQLIANLGETIIRLRQV